MKLRREYHKWFSPHLGREMELLIFGHAGERILVFPSRTARFFEYEDKGMVDVVQADLIKGRLQLVCVDSIDAESLYCPTISPRERIERHLQFERYITEEVLPFSEKLNPGSRVTAHGCSLGAYHAVALAFRRPDLVQRLVAFSGRYDLTKTFGEYHNLFFGYFDETLYLLMPSQFVPNLSDERMLGCMRTMNIVLVCGEEDDFFDNNRELSDALWAKGVWHAFHRWFGRAHRFRYWRQMARVYL